MTDSLVTTSCEFNQNGQGFFFATVSGVSCSEAFNLASVSLGAAEELLEQLVQVSEVCNLAFAIRTLVGQAKALVDSGVEAVEHAEDSAPQNLTFPVRGAEALA